MHFEQIWAFTTACHDSGHQVYACGGPQKCKRASASWDHWSHQSPSLSQAIPQTRLDSTASLHGSRVSPLPVAVQDQGQGPDAAPVWTALLLRVHFTSLPRSGPSLGRHQLFGRACPSLKSPAQLSQFSRIMCAARMKSYSCVKVASRGLLHSQEA